MASGRVLHSKRGHFGPLTAEDLELYEAICGPCVFGSNLITPLPQNVKQKSYAYSGSLKDVARKIHTFGECDLHRGQALQTMPILKLQYRELIHDAVNEFLNTGVGVFTSVNLARFMKEREIFPASYPPKNIDLGVSVSAILGRNYGNWGLSRYSNVAPLLYFKSKNKTST